MARGFTRYRQPDPTNPEASAVCDRGGEVRKRSELQREMVYRGNRVVWSGFMVCRHHIDPPHPQDRTLVLRPDPVPVENPRPLLPMVASGHDDPAGP